MTGDEAGCGIYWRILDVQPNTGRAATVHQWTGADRLHQNVSMALFANEKLRRRIEFPTGSRGRSATLARPPIEIHFRPDDTRSCFGCERCLPSADCRMTAQHEGLSLSLLSVWPADVMVNTVLTRRHKKLCYCRGTAR